METPSSTRRVTRSQTLVSVNNSSSSSSNNNNNIPLSRKIEDSCDKVLSKSRTRNTKNQQQDRSALIDITNDSPIVGLAMVGSLGTPSSAIGKQRTIRAKTPGSGEALLRGQVKTLLQKVEEEAELSKLSLESRPFLHLKGFVNSPMGLLAPTPMNTPHLPNLSEDGGINNSDLDTVTVSPIIVEQLNISQVVSDMFDGMKQESVESEKSLITRSLLLDFSEKSESSDSSECSSVVTTGEKSFPSPDDDDASIWSIQVNASTHDEDEEEVIEQEEEEEEEYCEEDYYEEDNEEGEEDDGGLVDELCEGISKISVTMPKFAGKHTRFEYSSDDEIVDGDNEDSDGFSMGILRLKGLPTPKGKHLRFPLEEDEDN